MTAESLPLLLCFQNKGLFKGQLCHGCVYCREGMGFFKLLALFVVKGVFSLPDDGFLLAVCGFPVSVPR